MKFFGLTVIILIHVNNAISSESKPSIVSIQNYDGPIYINPGENCVSFNNLTPTENHNPAPGHGQHNTAISHGQHHFISGQHNVGSSHDHHIPTLVNLPTTYGNHNILHSSVPYHSVCETDCKCITKQQTCVPIPVNSVPQNTCSPGYASTYPEGYGYVYPDYKEADVSSPKISETIIPLLKTYLSQSGTCKYCGLKH